MVTPDGGKRYFVNNGQKQAILTNDAGTYLKDNPEAVEYGLFDMGDGQKSAVRVDELPSFIKDNPNVKPFDTNDAPYYQDIIGQQARGAYDQMMDYAKVGAKAGNEPDAPKAVTPQMGGSSYAPIVPDLQNRPNTEMIGTFSDFGQSLKSGLKDSGAALLQVGEKFATNATPTPYGIAISMFDNAVSKVIDDESTPLATKQALNDYLTQPKTVLGQTAQALHASAQKDMPKDESLATMLGSVIPQMGLVVGTMFVPTLAPVTLSVMGSMGGGSQSLSYIDWIRNRNQTSDPVTYNKNVDAGGMILGAAFEMAFEHFGSFARYGINKAIPKGAANTMVGKLFSTKAGEKLAEDVFLDFMKKQPDLAQKFLKVGFQTLEEAGEETGTELANILTESLSYRDDMTIGEIVKRTAMSAAAGGLMGAMISPAGMWAQSNAYDNIRTQNGFVALASTKEGEAFEVLGQQGTKVYGVNVNGERINIDENDIEDYVKMSPEQFNEFRNVSIKSAEAVGEQAAAITPQQAKEAELRQAQTPTINTDDGLIHIVKMKGDPESIWYKIATNPNDTRISTVYNTETGKPELTSENFVIESENDPIQPDQALAQQMQELFPPQQEQQPIPRATFDGKTWTPGQATYQGNDVIISGQNEDGTITVTTPDGSMSEQVSPKD